jgi:DNA-binding FadR family transcriptional regulator
MQWSDQSGPPSRRRYLAVAEALLIAIARGEYPPGHRLPAERELATVHGVSRPTAREALLALELLGAVEVKHGDGAYVTGAQPRIGGSADSPLNVPPQELIETRSVLEPVVAGRAAMRGTPEVMVGLERDLEEASQLVEDIHQLPRFVYLGLRFHADLAVASGNSVLAGIVSQLVDVETHPLWALVNQQAVSSEVARRGQITEHRAILDSVAAGDARGAEQTMRDHLLGIETDIFLPGRAPNPTTAATPNPPGALNVFR